MRMFIIFAAFAAVLTAGCGQEATLPNDSPDKAKLHLATEEAARHVALDSTVYWSTNLIEPVGAAELSVAELKRLQDGTLSIPQDDFIANKTVLLKMSTVSSAGNGTADICQVPSGSMVTARLVLNGAYPSVDVSIVPQARDDRYLYAVCPSKVPASMSPEGWLKVFGDRSDIDTNTIS
jgi:hypothetical protein